MNETIDTRGLSCPQPVLMFLNAAEKTDKREILVLADSQVSKENISRAAETKGWTVKDIREKDIEYHITLTRN